MGDNRLKVDISVTGFDGKSRKIDWWVNWSENRPAEIYRSILELAKKSGLSVDESDIWRDYDESNALQIRDE